MFPRLTIEDRQLRADRDQWKGPSNRSGLWAVSWNSRRATRASAA